MTPEAKARQLTDQKLAQAGWVIQDLQQLNVSASVGVAVREYPTDAGPAPRSREIFHFFKPEKRATWFDQPTGLRRRLGENIPGWPARNLRDCQISAVTGLEKSLALNKPRTLVHIVIQAFFTGEKAGNQHCASRLGSFSAHRFNADKRYTNHEIEVDSSLDRDAYAHLAWRLTDS